MRPNFKLGKRKVSGKKRPHWGILTLDELDKTNGKHSRLISEFQTQHQSAKGPDKDKSNPLSEDYSI